MKLNEVPKVHTGLFPTPLYKLENLSSQLKSNIFIKRDDLSGLGFGGNKLRKLDYLVKEAKDNGYTALMTFGGVQTNHGRQTAALRKAVARKVIEMYEAKGEKVYEMPAGGSTPLGVMGYFTAVKEMMEQLKEMDQKIDYVVCASGSNGTFSGLWLGSRYYNAPWEVIGATVSPYSKQNNVTMAALINAASEKFELGITAEPDELRILGDYWGAGYDVPDEKTYQTIYRLARTEGLFVDPTYTGKGFTALLDLVESEKIPAGSNVLFIHTGGLPALWSEQHAAQFTKELWTGKEHTVISMDVRDCL